MFKRFSVIVLSFGLMPTSAFAASGEFGSTHAAQHQSVPPASPSKDPSPGQVAADWQAVTQRDLAAMAAAIRATDINAVYPDPVSWAKRLDTAFGQVSSEVPLVRNENGYRAVLQHFAASFHDAHVWVNFTTDTPPVEWPGFLATFDNGRYLVGVSRDPTIKVGSVVGACDGQTVSHWIDKIAPLEIGLPETLETTRRDVALRLFVDRGSPLRGRPAQCVIDAKPVTLSWRQTAYQDIGTEIGRLKGRRDPTVGTQLIADHGAWVKLGYFQPDTKAQADAYLAAVDNAALLRDRKFIVLDVRGNGGGPYNWFMAYLRGLYGSAYADYYATARLNIRGAYRILPSMSGDHHRPDDAEPFTTPADPPFDINDVENASEHRKAVAAGRPYFSALPIPHDRAAPPPPNLVHAKVYVLTDYGCGSACIGFVDELKLFPGVKQIGLPTFVDNRTGTPMPTLMPSGKTRVFAPMMTRDGRVRDDNVPQNPDIRFTGDITNDDAVERWVLETVVAEPPKGPLPSASGN